MRNLRQIVRNDFRLLDESVKVFDVKADRPAELDEWELATPDVVASSKPGPFREFFTALLAKGMRPEMARLTLARKIATIVLIVWKRGVCFDAQYLKPQTA